MIFGPISGPKINLHNSTLLGINTSWDQISRLVSMLECKVSKWPLTYLGLPLRRNPKATIIRNPVIDRISKRLDGWKKKNIFVLR